MKDTRIWTFLCVVLALGACVSPGKPYADFIGARYVVIADGLLAYGVYESRTDKRITAIDLIPMEVGGSEFAYCRNVPQGTVVRLLSARQRIPLMERSVSYLVAVENWDLPQGVAIELMLDRGNEGVSGDLNPALYRRLP